ncbi:AKC1 [Auxenochlorella protothecoides x Auxenochlorella symbiontica]
MPGMLSALNPPVRPFSTYTLVPQHRTRACPPPTHISRPSLWPTTQQSALLADIQDALLSSGPRGILRGAQVARIAAGLTLEQAQRVAQRRPPLSGPAVLRRLCEGLGATYIKLGQVIASMPSFFPPEYVQEFQACLDAAPPVPFSEIRPLIEAAAKAPLHSVYAHIDPVPLAAASVAQVHVGVLRASGKRVAIKVLRPGIEDTLRTDMTFLVLGARLLEAASPSLSRTSLAAMLSDFRTSVLGEANLEAEARHMAAFSAYLDASGARRLATCPEPYPAFSSRRVLVMDLLEGVPLTDAAVVVAHAPGTDPEAVLRAALDTWTGSLLACETFHADVHAGNLLVLRDGRVGFIDFGIVGSVSPVTWAGVRALGQALVAGDWAAAAAALATVGVTEARVSVQGLAADLAGLAGRLGELDAAAVLSSMEGGPSAGALEAIEPQINKILVDLTSMGEKHGIRFPREFGLLIKQLLYFDRYTRILAPSLSVFDGKKEVQPHDYIDV